MILLHLFLAFSRVLQGSCSTFPDISTKVDRLIIFRRFGEIKELFSENPEAPRLACTAQVIARCIEASKRRDKSLNASDMINLRFRSASNDYVDASVTQNPDEVITEAKALFEVLLPYAIHSKLIMTRVMNYAIFCSDFDLIRRLLDIDGWALFDEDQDGFSPLMSAIRYHNPSAFHWLIDNGADIHYINSKGENLFHTFSRHTKDDSSLIGKMFSLAREEQLDFRLLNSKSRSPIDIAISYDNIPAIQLLNQLECADLQPKK